MKKALILVNHEIVIYNFRKELVDELIHKGYQVYISCPYGKKIELLKKAGVQYINTSFNRRGINPFKEIQLIYRYAIILKRIHPDIVLTYTVKPNIYGGFLCRFFHINYLPNITGLGTSLENGGFFAKVITIMYRQALKEATCVFFQNETNLRWARENRLAKKRLYLLPGSGVNLEEFHVLEYPAKEQDISFLYLGRLMKDKGIDELLSAARNTLKKYPRVKFYLAGEQEKEYSVQLQDAFSTEHISYLGFQTDVKKLIKNCSAVVLPSYHEGMANVLLEASASGRPVLASNIPGCKEAFDEGITGLGFEPRSVESLEQTIEKFILLPHEVKEQMGIEARKKMEREFDRNIVINAYLEEIDKIRMGENRI